MTHQHSNHDPIDRLRAADPAAGTTTDPTLPHVRATLEEIVMSQTERDTTSTAGGVEPTPDRRRPAPWLLAAAVAVVLAGVVGVIVRSGDDSTTADDLALVDDGAADPINPDGVETDPGAAGESSVTSCVESYDLDTLGNREYAFDGTVESVDGNDMTFTVNEWFSATTVDGEAATVTLDHQGLSGMLFGPEGPTFDPGTRVLVAGDGGFVWSCGFTQLYDEAVAGQWRTALG